ncbi:putative post-transcriptional transactivator [Marmot herpesvirus 1]|nr:putative post-transcriptional transactivator [Marmot herpesvirus 1]
MIYIFSLEWTSESEDEESECSSISSDDHLEEGEIEPSPPKSPAIMKEIQGKGEETATASTTEKEHSKHRSPLNREAQKRPRSPSPATRDRKRRRSRSPRSPRPSSPRRRYMGPSYNRGRFHRRPLRHYDTRPRPFYQRHSRFGNEGFNDRFRQGHLGNNRPFSHQGQFHGVGHKDKTFKELCDIARDPDKLPFDESLLRCNRGLFFAAPYTPQKKPEDFDNNFVVDIAAAGSLSVTNIKHKMIPVDRISLNFSDLRMLFCSSCNYYYWNCMRKQAIFNSGLSILPHMLDEMIVWSKEYMARDMAGDMQTQDVLLSTAECLSIQLCTKLKPMLNCYVKSSYHLSLLKRVCNMVCAGGMMARVGPLLVGEELDFAMGAFMLYALAIPMISLQGAQNKPVVTHFKKLLKMYKAGDAAALFSRTIHTHRGCTNRVCCTNTKALLGNSAENHGLFFIPID